MMGGKAAARKSYQDFLTLLKDADPGIPIYQPANAEYAKLCEGRKSRYLHSPAAAGSVGMTTMEGRR